KADGNNLCTPVLPETNYQPAPPPGAAPYTLGTVLDLTNRDENVQRYLMYGWAGARGLETWTEGPLAMLRLGLDRTIDASRALDLDVDADPLLATPRHPRLDVDVFVNGTEVAQWSYDAASWTPRQHARIPDAVVAARHGLDIEFHVRNPE